MRDTRALRIGLPYGKHIRKEVYATLKTTGIDVPDYLTVEQHRRYSFKHTLPSGGSILFFVDNPRDLIYRLAENLCDAVITGSDYVRDWKIFQKAQTHLPKKWQELTVHKFLKFENITACTGRLNFLVHESCGIPTLDEFFYQTQNPVCFTEFPYLASRKIQKSRGYTSKYHSVLPQLLATFFSTHGTYGVQFPIIYSHGLTESKAITNKNVIIYDIMCSGKTSNLNNLKSIYQDHELIYVGLFGINKTNPDNNTARLLTEFTQLLKAGITKTV